MSPLSVLIAAASFILALGPPGGTPSQSAMEKKYEESLRRVFAFQDEVAPVHAIFKQAYPIAIVEDKTFFVFEPVPEKRVYRLVSSAPDTSGMPRGIRAAMPLGFWDNRPACVVTGEVFGEPDGYVFIFHEFVHCAQWECCEQKIKSGLAVYQEAMEKKDYAWELQFPFPYEDKAFGERYAAFLAACDQHDLRGVESIRADLKKSLSTPAWEYLTWQEWKEGLARYLENRIRQAVGQPENAGGKNPPFNRVTFYYGGDTYIRFLERQRPGVVGELENLYRLISR